MSKRKIASLIFTRAKGKGNRLIYIWDASLGAVRKIPRNYGYHVQWNGSGWQETFIASISPTAFKRLFGFTLPKGKQASGNITLCTASRK